MSDQYSTAGQNIQIKGKLQHETACIFEHSHKSLHCIVLFYLADKYLRSSPCSRGNSLHNWTE